MPARGLQSFAFMMAVLVMGPALAQERPDMIGGGLDLKRAVLSPAPFGPPSQFAPVTPAAGQETAKVDATTPEPATPAQASPAPAKAETAKAEETTPERAKPAADRPRRAVSRKPRQKPAVATRKPRSNPLDSFARDPRRQVWPCRGGGICAWTQPR